MIWAAIGLAVLFAVFALLYWRIRGQIRHCNEARERLDQSIRSFLSNPERADFALTEDDAAGLQNSVARLQDAYLQAQTRLAGERERNHQFIADVSHQLKTPLAGLKLYVELTDGAYLSKELALIERMETLIRQLLRMEKLRTGAYEFQYERIDLGALITAVWQELAPMFPEYQLDLAGDAVLRADRVWLMEGIHNILKNACQQAAARQEIHVRLAQSDTLVSIEIEDFGGGLKDAAAEHLFARFSPAVQHDQKNSGLGLAITKAIMERHHGSIYARNTAGGMLVGISLPVHDGYQTY